MHRDQTGSLLFVTLFLVPSIALAADGGVADAGLVDDPLPIISEVAWMGGVTSANDEFVEITNPTGTAIPSLSAFVLVEGATQHPLPDVPLGAYGVLVIERSAGATSLASPDAVVIAFTGGLLNGPPAEILRLCRAADLLDCDTANPGAVGWFAGSNTAPKRTMVRRRHDLDGTLAASWKTFDGSPSIVTDSGGVAWNGSPGTFEDEIVEPPVDGGVVDGGVDGGLVDAGPPPFQPLPVISEVAWMGASASGDEWVEVTNPSDIAIVDLSAFVLVEGAGQHILPAVPLAPGAVVVLERSAAATSLAPPEAEIVAFASLTNTGEILKICRGADLLECDVANPAGGAWFAGSNTAPKVTMTRRRLDLDGTFSTSWKDHDGLPSTVTDSAGLVIQGSPGVVVEEDPPPPPPDGGIVDAGPPPFQPLPLISEVAWMGSASSADDEWLELFNPGPDDIVDLSAFVLVEGATTHALPAASIGRGQVLVVERNLTSTSLESPQTVTVPFSSGLSNTGEILRVCRADDLEDCDIANPGGPWYAGSNGTTTQPKATMVRVSPDYPGALASSWTNHAGPASLITDSTGAGIPGTPGSAIFPDPDGGVIDEDGGIPYVDAGPNEGPTIVVHEPSGNVTSNTVAITWDATDADGDPLEVSLFYDTDGLGFEGVLIERGLPGGIGEGTTWNTSGVASGTWRVFAKVSDPRGAVAYAYAPGTVTVEGNAGEATLAITEPDGVNDADTNNVFTITWTAALPGGAEGVVSLYTDTDDSGEDGTPIAAGLNALTVDSFTWITDQVEAGTYAVYGVLDWTGGRVVSYGGFVDVGQEGCACVTSQGGADTDVNLPLSLGIAILLATRIRRRRR
jgi:MYXO-CTERM domain-containing protein